MQHKQPEPQAGPAPPADAAAADAQPEVLQLFAEEAQVSRQTVESGRVRVATITHTRDHLVDEMLARTNVEVERIPVGRLIDAIPPVAGDADHTIIPIVEETVVVERKLVLKEEVHIRLKRTTERYQETVQLRHQTAEVSRIPTQNPADRHDPAAGTMTERNREE
jgi:uncharacterized protein (TIGR02271 family)